MSAHDRSTSGINTPHEIPSRSHQSSYVSVACENCKRSKRKCDGDNPCQACVARGLQCVIDGSKDGRRGRKRTLGQLYNKADALDLILSSLKSFDNKSLQELLALIRSDASLEEVVAHTRSMLRQETNQDHSRVRLQRAVMDIASLIDEPPIQVPAKPWTDVTDDDHSVSHLISVYFTWQHYGYPSVDRDIFVREMQSKNLSSLFCSPLLVNSMLAVACMHTDHRSAFANPSDPSTRATHFLDEAIRLYTLEQGKPSLAALQALPPLISGVITLGKDRIGLMYTSESVTLSAELAGEVKKKTRRGVADFTTAEFERSYALALWAAYMIQTEVAIGWAKPLEFRLPLKPYPYRESDLSIAKPWQPYPRVAPDCSFFPFALQVARFELYHIAADLRPLVLSGDPEESPLPGYVVLDRDVKLDRLHTVEKQLLGWYHRLPLGARLGEMDDSPPAGPLADLHIAYHSFRIATANLFLRMSELADVPKRAAMDTTIDACRHIASIFEWLQRTIGLVYFGIYHVHGATLSAYGLLEHLSQPDIPDVFHTMVVALSTASHRWTLARGVVRMIWIELQQRKLERFLKESTVTILKLSAVDSWGPEDHRVFERCAYPNYAALKERGNVFAEMGELLEQYSQLQVGDNSETQQEPSSAV